MGGAARVTDEEPTATDILEVLEAHSSRRGFAERWRAFMRDCAVPLLATLPQDAGDWVAAADEFEAGRLSEAALTQCRVRAWTLHDAIQNSPQRPTSLLSGLQVAMYRLWPTSDDWYVEAVYFLEACREAGLKDEFLLGMLRERIASELPPDVAGRSSP